MLYLVIDLIKYSRIGKQSIDIPEEIKLNLMDKNSVAQKEPYTILPL